MKRRDLIQQIEAMGCVLVRHGGKHDWYQNPRTKWLKQFLVIGEIHEFLARSILKKLSDASGPSAKS